MSFSQTAVTLATTAKAIVPVLALPVLGSNYFGWVGKACRMRIWGQMTTGTTPGNGIFSLLWGTGADANGTTILTNATAFALGASQTNLTWEIDCIVRCRAVGTSGSVICHGMMSANVNLIASTLQPVMFPTSAPAAVTIDTTANNVLSPQFQRSGSTAETMQVTEFVYEALN
jgi:hypothetical protein